MSEPIFPFSNWEVSSSISFRQQSVCNNRLYATTSTRVFSLTALDADANFISLLPDVFLTIRIDEETPDAQNNLIDNTEHLGVE